MNMNVYMPTRLFTGRGCVREKGAAFTKLGKACLILTGKHAAKKSGALDDVTAVLDEQGISWRVFDGIGQNPLFSACVDAAKEATAFGAEFVIGIGGGSPMDAAKCTAVLAANPGMSQEEAYSYNWPKKPLPIAAVGTTAGTGSEVTKVSVITTLEGRKKSLNADPLYPAVSFGDASYTMTLSDEFTRSTAIDALAHCMESYFTRAANEISQTYSVRGIRMLIEEFRKIISNGTESLTFEDREKLYHASVYGGLAIAVTGTCMPHAMGYMLTEDHGVPHGVACALFLPQFYYHNKRVNPELIEQFLKEIGCGESEFLYMLSAVMPEYDIYMTEAEIASSHSRWVGNASIAKAWGEITPEMAEDILRRLFG